MENEFIPYEQALALKELGFNEECLGYYIELKNPQEGLLQIGLDDDFLQAPLYQQAFRWFREKHGFFSSPTQYDDDVIKKYDWHITKNLGDGKLLIKFVGYHDTYEEAELACLLKLIEIVKEKKS